MEILEVFIVSMFFYMMGVIDVRGGSINQQVVFYKKFCCCMVLYCFFVNLLCYQKRFGEFLNVFYGL